MSPCFTLGPQILFVLQLAVRTIYQPLPGGPDGKEFACSVGDLDLIPGLGRSPGEGNGDPLQYSCLEKSHGQRSLADYPWGHRVIHD